MTANSSSVSTWFRDDDNNRNETSLGIVWDDWDLDLWTPEQRQLLELGRIPRQVYIVLGVLLTLIVLFGFTANATILYVFSRFAVLNLFVCCQSTNNFIFLPFEKTGSNDWELRPTCSSSIWRFAISWPVVSIRWPSIPPSGDDGHSVKQVERENI